MNAPRWRHCCAKERGIFHLPAGAKCAACGEAAKQGVPEAVRGKFAMLREEFRHLSVSGEAHARRWRELTVDERRLLLAAVGLDESEEAARRPWETIMAADRVELLNGLRGMRRLVGRLQWA